jgi:hypothetical protein
MNSNITLKEIWALCRETDRRLQEAIDRLAEKSAQQRREAGLC